MKNIEARKSHSILSITTLTILTLLCLGVMDQVQAQQWTTNSNDISNTNSGNVGIGTASPNAKLAFGTASGAGAKIHLFDDVATSRYGMGIQPAEFQLFVPTAGHFSFNSGGDIQASGTNELMRITGGGNVGIGTSSPSYRLHVVGNNSSSYPILKLQNTQTGGHSWWLYSGATGAADSFGLYDETAGSYRMYFDGTGHVGFGTTSSPGKLTIASTTANDSTGIYLDRSPGYTTGASTTLRGIYVNQTGSLDSTTNEGIYVNVSHLNSTVATGINANASGTYTSVIGVSSIATKNIGAGGADTFAVKGVATSGSANSAGSVYGGYFSNTATGSSLYGIYVNTSTTGSTNYGVYQNGGAQNYFSGKVGIGNATPTHTLEVNGDASFSGTITGGNFQAVYQDVAEWVPSSHALPAGTVVILNPDKSNEVMPSQSAYDTRVAGVVSERPGLSLGEAGKDKSLVATTGRVKVMVDASKAPIHVGDLLVTSDEEGVAMKSEPVDVAGVKLHRPGTLIGKALEPLESGKGKILVLLSLQ